MSSTLIVAFFVGLLILCLVSKVFSWPLRMLWKAIYNSVIGAIILYIVNLTGFVHVPIDFITALIAGVFGIPGVLVLIIITLL